MPDVIDSVTDTTKGVAPDQPGSSIAGLHEGG